MLRLSYISPRLNAREIHIRLISFNELGCFLQNAATARERHNVEEGIQVEEQLLAEQGQLRVDVVDLTRLAQIKADEREQKARDYLKADLRYQKTLEDLKTKELVIEDSAKKYKEVKLR